MMRNLWGAALAAGTMLVSALEVRAQGWERRSFSGTVISVHVWYRGGIGTDHPGAFTVRLGDDTYALVHTQETIRGTRRDTHNDRAKVILSIVEPGQSVYVADAYTWRGATGDVVLYHMDSSSSLAVSR